MKNLTHVLTITIVLIAASITTVMAQNESLQLSVSRTWDYAGFNRDILGGLGVGLIILLVIIAIFDAVLKVIGAWKASRRSQTAWFVCLLIFNTAGILPIIYFLTGGKKPETLGNTSR